MPIGFEPGGGGGGRMPAAEPGAGASLDPWGHESEPAAEEAGFWAWVEVEADTVYPVVWTRWETREDERVCPECGPLDGLAWEEGAGVMPPLHVNCRCERVYGWTEGRTRYATTWELRWIPA